MTSGYRRFIVPAISTVAMLAVLIALGTWQVRRLHWKEAILARIATAEASPPIALPPGPVVAVPPPFTKIAVAGRFRFDLEARFGDDVRDMPGGAAMGYGQIVPLERDGAPDMLVLRGWVPEKRVAALDEPAGRQIVTGYVRPAEGPHWFSPADDVADRRFYTLDPAAIGRALGLSNLEPFILVAVGPSEPGLFPDPARQLPRPPNNHLSYVVTWYGLAVVLLVIFGTWVRKTVRS